MEAQHRALFEAMSTAQKQAFLGLSADEKRELLDRLARESPTAQRLRGVQRMQQYPQRPGLYRVFRPELDVVPHDPLDPAKRYHDGVWIENDPENAMGTMYHVTQDIIRQGGMVFEEKKTYPAARSSHLHDIHFVGYLQANAYDSGRVKNVLSALPTPPKQQGLDFKNRSSRIIWTTPEGEPYSDGVARPPVFKCNEWTERLAIPALVNHGFLRRPAA